MNEPRLKVLNTIETYFAPIKDGAIEAIQKDLTDILKSFGNCTICWGKGYNIVSGLEYCSCDRGQRLKKFMEVMDEK